MPNIRPLGLRSFGDGVSPIEAADWRSVVDFYERAFAPGIIGYSPAANDVAKAAISGTKIVVGAMNGQKLVSGNAVLTEWLTDELDFATGAEDGGPLPAATYKIYIRLARGGTDANRYFVGYPAATNESAAYTTEDPAHADAHRRGFVNEAVYFVSATVVWNGSTTLSSLVDLRDEKKGAIDLTLLGVGTGGYVKIGNASRGVQITGLVVDSAFLDNLYFNVDANVYSLGNFRWEFTGHTEFSFGNGAGPSTLFDMGKNVDLLLREGSVLDLLDDAVLNLAAAGVFNLYGEQYVKNGGLIDVQAGGGITFNTDSTLLAPLALAGPPAQRNVCWDHFPRAIAVVAHAGTLVDGINVSSVNKTGTGVYEVNFTTDMTTVNYGAIATANGTTGRRTCECDVATNLVTVKTFDDAGAAADANFTVMVLLGALS